MLLNRLGLIIIKKFKQWVIIDYDGIFMTMYIKRKSSNEKQNQYTDTDPELIKT